VRAWRLNDSGAAPRLICEDIPTPHPGPGEVLIRVHAAGVTPTEMLWYPTTNTKSGERRHHAVPGHEFAGTVAAIGLETGGPTLGQEIYGMNDWFADGATAEYCVTRPEWIASKPRRLPFAEAASVPIGALTAWQGLFDRVKLQRGETVLIHGGSGAVGVFAVQLARRHGAHVVTTASARNRGFLLQLGAERVIDYRVERFEEIVRGIDVVFDGVGGTTLQRSWDVLAHSGRLVTIAADSEGTADERTKSAFFIVEPNQQQLSGIGALLDAGEIQPVVEAEVPFAQAGEAYAAGDQPRSGRGKVVVVVV
jgi:NADPH:quinone reductase-like Zn-dependent oxidoreductase